MTQIRFLPTSLILWTEEPGALLSTGPTTSWEIDGETVETVSDFIFLGSKITADGDCSHEIKRRVMTNLPFLENMSISFLVTKKRLP